MFKRLTFTLLAAALLALSACTTVVQSQNPDLRTINVNGTGTASASPDIATAEIAVVSRNADVKAASDQNTRAMAGVLSSLNGLGVADDDIQTINYSISIEEQFDSEGKPTGQRVFVINNTVRAKFRDLSKVGAGLQAAIDAGANQISNITFGVEETDALMAEARAKAMADAKARADQLAQAAGIEINKPYTISEYSTYAPSGVRADVSALATDGGAPVPVQPGQIMVQVDVQVTYLIK